MDTNNNNINSNRGAQKGKIIAGVILLCFGASWFFREINFFFLPGWLFSWPMWLIAGGLYVGANNSFRNSSWVFAVAIGVLFLLGEIVPGLHAGALVWPGMLIVVGIWLIVKRNNKGTPWDQKGWKEKWDNGKYDFSAGQAAAPEETDADYTTTGSETKSSASQGQPFYTGDEHLDALSIFGSVKKTIYSKNFQGGEIVNVFGGAEVDLTQADLNGRIYVEVTQVFGGVKMIVPSHWTVVSDVAAVFAGFDDKRVRTTIPQDTNKVLVLKGISIFAGIDIRSY